MKKMRKMVTVTMKMSNCEKKDDCNDHKSQKIKNFGN